MKEDIASPTIDVASNYAPDAAIFNIGQKKEFSLGHEIGAGSKCRNCDCPGLDLHFWRKICKKCRCRMDEHDVLLPNQFDHGQLVIGRLFMMKDHFDKIAAIHDKKFQDLRHVQFSDETAGARGSVTSSSPRETQSGPQSARTIPTAVYNFTANTTEGAQDPVQYSWVPIPDEILVEKYMNALPVVERPIAGSVGEQNRKSRLQYQLPLYDCNVDDARFASPNDRQILGKFVDNVKSNIIGVGHVVDLNKARKDKATNLLDNAEDNLQKAIGNLHCNLGLDNCQHCKDNLGDIGVQTDHGKNDDTWHPNCFRCATCDQLLVDMIYFFHDKKYYCGRHYADLMYPRCAGCDELIFANEYTFAEDKPWHFEHFACFKCDDKLGGKRYMNVEEQPNCIPCYMLHHAKDCETCKQKIGPDEQRLSYKEYHWHAKPECFSCPSCKTSLVGKKFVLRHPHVFCSSQCKSNFGSN